MPGRNIVFFIALAIAMSLVHAKDLDHPVAGDSEIEDVLGASKDPGNSPYLIEGESKDTVKNARPNGVDYIFNHGVKEVTVKETPKKKFEDTGYTPPGTFEHQKNYIDLDKTSMARDFRKASSGGVNLSFIKNGYTYDSNNDIINRTISSGAGSVKGGSLLIRNDSYVAKSKILNAYWAAGLGVGYNSGKGIFVDGNRSDATFNLWEVPLDVGVGLEVPIATWFKIAATGGPSVMGLVQNRSDYERGEKGKRKFQVSPGYFATAQFKINLSGFSEEAAYELFTSSAITNLYMNLEARLQNYSNFQDDISIHGASFGIGFTFEYL